MGILPDGFGTRMPVDKPPATESPSQAFSENDRFLIQKTEESIRDGLQLERWCRERRDQIKLFPLDLKKQYRLANRAEDFFGTLPINGSPRSVMGCVQNVEFGSLTGPRAPERLREFVLEEFLKLSHWTYEDGASGGFTFEKILFKTSGGEYGEYPPAECGGPMNWHDIGPKYAWVLLLVHIHDFVLEMGPLKMRVREAAYVRAESRLRPHCGEPLPGMPAGNLRRLPVCGRHSPSEPFRIRAVQVRGCGKALLVFPDDEA